MKTKIENVTTDQTLFNVAIVAPDGIESLGAAQYRIMFDPDVLKLVNVTLGKDITGKVHVNWHQFGTGVNISYFKTQIPAIAVPANGELMILTFEKINVGSTALSFDHPWSKAFDGSFQQMPMLPLDDFWLNGSVTIQEPGTAPFAILSTDVEYFINTILPEQLLPAIQAKILECSQDWFDNMKPQI